MLCSACCERAHFLLRCFWDSRGHCILTLRRKPKQHKFTFWWLPFETNSLKSSPLVHCLFYTFHINFFSSVNLLLILHPFTKFDHSKFWQQPKNAHLVETPFVKEIVYFWTFLKSDCRGTPGKGSCPCICIIFSYFKDFLSRRQRRTCQTKRTQISIGKLICKWYYNKKNHFIDNRHNYLTHRSYQFQKGDKSCG